MRSLSSRLLALWLMLAASALVIGFVLFQFYRQSANAQVSQAEEAVARACRDIGDRYSFFLAGWKGAGQESIDDDTKRGLTDVLQAALARATGVEGGIWQGRFGSGSLAYAFPTYEGSGPKTDLPVAELATIRQVNAESLSAEADRRSRNCVSFLQLNTRCSDVPVRLKQRYFNTEPLPSGSFDSRHQSRQDRPGSSD